MRSIVINLAQETARLAHVGGQFESIGAQWERLEASDVRDWPEAELARFRADRAHTAQPYEWRRGQIGALLSHMAAWRSIGDGEDEWGAVFEDDVHLDPVMARLLASSDWIPPGQDIVRFETTRQGMRLGPSLATGSLPPPFRLKPVRAGAWGAAGYAIRRDTARWLAHAPPKQQAPADWLMFHAPTTVASQLAILQLDPAPCVQDQYLKEDRYRFGFISGTEPVKPGRELRWLALRQKIADIMRPLLGKQSVPFSGVGG